uniref:Uncharacterized protein n=1 Tax=Arundo donax TaxID=35708 RepID=A0A0A9IAS0_ARUDO
MLQVLLVMHLLRLRLMLLLLRCFSAPAAELSPAMPDVVDLLRLL